MTETIPLEKVVGDTSSVGPVQLVATATSCFRVIIRPGGVDAGTNIDPIYAIISNAKPTHAQALTGRYIDEANYEGIIIYCTDASQVWLAGTNAGDKAYATIVQ